MEKIRKKSKNPVNPFSSVSNSDFNCDIARHGHAEAGDAGGRGASPLPFRPLQADRYRSSQVSAFSTYH